ncbi:MAG: CPBP family intramembrane metalloprotease [Lachnospiraceae bacterium]|nr:CPBP family intramembrane metalloprotease [Lachnospiraceae bacterium]
MHKYKILTKYLLPLMLQITAMAFIAFMMKSAGIETGYGSVIGIILIVLSGISSALWGILYQCRYHHKNLIKIIIDFINVKQRVKSYLLVIMFLSIDFGWIILNKGFHAESPWLPILLFLKAIAFGGIEEIGWRYTFQPAIEYKITYVPAVFATFICWGIWHFLFFYIDGSITVVNVPFFLLGLLTNCFILSALYAYSGSLWICVMTHALINALSQIAVDDNSIVNILLKIVCMIIAVGLYTKMSTASNIHGQRKQKTM